jgi:hypothetical protein
MNPVFFVQNNYVQRVTAPVAIYARERGIRLEDRSSSSDFDPDDCGIEWASTDLVLPYGSVQFLRRLKSSSLAHFVLHDEASFAASNWARLLGNRALGGAGLCVPAHEVRALLRQRGPMHLRPDAVDKAFVGAVFDADTWGAERVRRELANDLMCWASPVAQIDAEWRSWVIGGVVVEVSQYRRAGTMHVQRETSLAVHEAAQKLASTFTPAPCVVLDIARVRGQYVVVEFNPIHCSGWYAADVAQVLDAWVRWTVSPQSAPSP